MAGEEVGEEWFGGGQLGVACLARGGDEGPLGAKKALETPTAWMDATAMGHPR